MLLKLKDAFSKLNRLVHMTLNLLQNFRLLIRIVSFQVKSRHALWQLLVYFVHLHSGQVLYLAYLFTKTTSMHMSFHI